MKNTIITISLLTASSLLVGCTSDHLPPDVTPQLSSAEEIRAKLASGGGASQEEEVTIEFGGKFATLKGKFTLNGDPPANPPLKVDKDLSVCNPSGAAILDKKVIVDGSGGLANVLLYAEVPTEWCHESMIGKTDTVDFDQKNCLFLDRIFPMQTTQKLRLLNSDNVGHNADLKPGRNTPFNQNIAGGGFALYPSDDAPLKPEKSPFTVSCSAHPWMSSYLIFRENGYFAVTAEDGSYELPNLPADVPVKITVWHEACRGVSGNETTPEPSDLAKGWNKRGTFTITLNSGNPETVLNVAINSAALSK